MVGYGYFLELPISMGHNGSPRLACPIKEHWRYSLFWLQVDPLSLCPSCANGNRKENLKTWRWEAHERRAYRLSPIDWIMYCFHNAKYDWLMLRALTTRHHSRYVRRNACRNVKKISFSENKTSESEQIKALELRLTGHDVLTILPTGYGKSCTYFFGKAFCLEPKCEHVSDFPTYKH